MRLKINRICVPTDFSRAADHAVHYAAALAHSFGAEMHLLHVITHAGSMVHHQDFSASGEVARAYFQRLERAVADVDQPMESENDDTTPELSELIKQVSDGAVEQMDAVSNEWWKELVVHRDVRHGHPVKEINRYVERFNIDLVVMATHGHSNLADALLGSVTERVLRTCACPVTVIRHPQHKYDLVE